MLNIKKSEYYPREIVIKEIDPYVFKTPEDIFNVLKSMHIGIISYIDMCYEITKWGEQQPYAIVQFEKWNTSTTRDMRKQLENGRSVDILSVGRRAYMVDYQRRRFLEEKQEEERHRIRKQREEEERRIRKQREEERRIREQKEYEERRIRKQKEYEEQQRRNREAAEQFNIENQYINDIPVFNDLEIDYGDEETKFFKFNIKTGEMDYKGRQYMIYQ